MYDYNKFKEQLSIINSQFKKDDDSYKKIFDALKDTLDACDSVNKLNKDELNIFFQAITNAFISSHVNEKNNRVM